MASVRDPVRPLDSASVADGYPKELLVDFSTGNLLILDANKNQITHKKPGALTVKSGSVSILSKTNLYDDFTLDLATLLGGSVTPKAAGTAAVGTSNYAAKADHVHPLQTAISGNAGTATKLATARNIGLAGVTATAASFDGSEDVNITITAIPVGLINGLATVATSGKYSDLSGRPTIYQPSTTTPKAAGTAAVGTGTTFARADHVHPLQTTITGNAGTATVLQTARTIALSGAVTGTATSFDGSKDITIPVTTVDGSKITGTIPLSSIPKGAQERMYPVTNDTARLALTGDDVQNGDVVKVTATGIMYYIKDETKLGTEDAFEVFAAGTAARLGTDAGGVTQPVYFKNGVPVATTYSLSKSVPANAVFTDTTYTAGTGLTLTGTEFKHSNSITAGTVKGDNNKTLTYGGTFKVPSITYDAQGHITGTTTTTMTMPALNHITITKTSDTSTSGALAHGGKFTAVTGVTRDTHGHVTTIATKEFTLPNKEHPDITVNDNTEDAESLAHAGTFTAIDSVVRDSYGHITGYNIKTYTLPSAPGAVGTADKLSVADTGSATKPVYFKNGVPVATTYTLAKSVPADAKFTDTTYTAGTGLTLTGTEFKHSNSVTAGTAKGDDTKTLTYGGTFKIPSIAYDNQGHITGTTTTTMTMPSLQHISVSVADPTSATAETLAYGGKFTVLNTVTRDTYGHVTGYTTKQYTLPSVSHPTVTTAADTSSTAGPDYGGTFTAIDSVTRDTYGHVTKINVKTITMPSLKHISVTKNTDTTSSVSGSFGGTVTMIDGVTRDSYGHVTTLNTKTLTLPSLPVATNKVSGIVSTTTQTFAGAKTFSTSVTTPSLTVSTPGAVAGIAVTYQATLSAAGWNGTEAPYNQILSLPGVTETDRGVWMDIRYSGDYATDTGYDEAFANVHRAESSSGAVTVYFNEKPEIDIPVNITVVR